MELLQATVYQKALFVGFKFGSFEHCMERNPYLQYKWVDKWRTSNLAVRVKIHLTTKSNHNHINYIYGSWICISKSDTHIHSYCTSITESYLLDLIYTAGS